MKASGTLGDGKIPDVYPMETGITIPEKCQKSGKSNLICDGLSSIITVQ